jgi:L-alanine-DL-glutamate epimerase-like enolase superfamily enzyme
MSVRVNARDNSPEAWAEAVDAWREAGATHVALNTMDNGFSSAQHIETIRRYREALGAQVTGG